MDGPRYSMPVVLISANIEWRAIRELFPDVNPDLSPYGEWFITNLLVDGAELPVVFLHGGWGKISAAASTQYAIDRWKPDLLINLGTCGGFKGCIERGTVVLVEKTVVYDILEQMGDFDEHIAHYTTHLDLSWLEGKESPQPVVRTLLVSADRDLVSGEIPGLMNSYGAVAGDWESGAIAFVAVRNEVRTLILRGVTDLVGSKGGEAYDGNLHVFIDGTKLVIQSLVANLAQWIELSWASKKVTKV